jgi:hypothetical protein
MGSSTPADPSDGDPARPCRRHPGRDKAAFEYDVLAIKPVVERLPRTLEERDRGAFITLELYTLRLTGRQTGIRV